jgi:ribosomal protein S18 acetylase RimI-like enzyme
MAAAAELGPGMRPAAAGTLVDAVAHPAEALRLMAQYRDGLRALGKTWADVTYAMVRQRIEDYSFTGQLWLGPADEPIAIAGWETAGSLGRRGWIHVADGSQSKAVLDRFLDLLDAFARPSLPFISWSDEIPGIDLPERESIFKRRGFFPVVRADMVFPEGAAVPHGSSDPTLPTRHLSIEDEPLIADLLYRAYRGEPERALFATTRDEEEDARTGTHELLHGGVGHWRPDASFGIEQEGRLIAQTLGNEFGGGLITEVNVDPAFRRRGLARGLLTLTVEGLRAAGFGAPRLVVSMWNSRAVQLYTSMGFVFVPGGEGRVWLDLQALGVNPPVA